MYCCVYSCVRPASRSLQCTEIGKRHFRAVENSTAQNSDPFAKERTFFPVDLTECLTFLYYLILLEECKQCPSNSIAVAAEWPLGLGFFFFFFW